MKKLHQFVMNLTFIIKNFNFFMNKRNSFLFYIKKNAVRESPIRFKEKI